MKRKMHGLSVGPGKGMVAGLGRGGRKTSVGVKPAAKKAVAPAVRARMPTLSEMRGKKV